MNDHALPEASVTSAVPSRTVATIEDEITQALEYLGDRLARLTLHLDSVVSPPGPERDEAGMMLPVNSPLASRLHAQLSTIQRFGRLVDDLADRIDL